MKMKLENALRIAEPNNPKPVNQPNSRLRFVDSSVSGDATLGVGFVVVIRVTLLGGIHQLFHVGPEHLVLGVFKIAKPVAFDCEDEQAGGARAHHETGSHRNEG
jgi:hypothetical protein